MMRTYGHVMLAAIAVLVLAGCGGGTDGSDHGSAHSPSATASAPTGPAGETVNAADVKFAGEMIPHHAQAVEMADLAATRATDRVKSLAAEIKKAQGPEIETMTGWLRSWNRPVPPVGGEHGGHGMPGMMTADDMVRLSAARGTAFDRLFLELMIRHHEGAVEMANTEKAQGVHPGARALADAVVRAQTTEIDTMRRLLGSG
ncbi:uncharacterized protein (DUF305 family) [Herbihabitans rhizosphaerae]|uniref:Uncharacterized protein (DUF305 family) n=1 Tax=Herbihabitans rhizosphaerae TaxID=1872711 RepID=A0A4Q7KKJ8_9PSEU|nr:DUF305 domain-containing protein [Herbihabitans rhizosphaerae]RZS36400.1 uncharacterized protein (DUF305 family) [Herbihabitans rhizosphaerae]